MYDHVLVPVAFDHDNLAVGSLPAARHLLNEGGKVTLLHVLEQIPSFVEQYLPDGTADANRSAAHDNLKRLASDAGENTSTAVVLGHAYREILEFAQGNDVDCIVIASHKPGFEEFFLGSTAARVVRHAKCAVHVLR